jgi:hypothetical protein
MLTFFTDPTDSAGTNIVNCDISATTCSADLSSGCPTYVKMGDEPLYPSSTTIINVELNTANVINFSMTCEEGTRSFTNTV